MFKYVLEVEKQNLSSLLPRNAGFLFYVLISISKKYFQESHIFLQIKEKLSIENSEVAIKYPLSFLFSSCVVEKKIE